jgi:NADPH:quinone reductase-like Zn-dependent oxidoreductase
MQGTWYWANRGIREKLFPDERDNEDNEQRKTKGSNMKAVRIHQYGGPEVLANVEMKRPTPGPNEVLIKVQAASVNPADWKLRAGYMKQPLPLTFPSTLGWDVSGTVEEAGADATQFKRGDEVYALLEGGGYAEYAVARESVVARKPRTLDYAQTAAVPVAGLTAWQALFEVAQLSAGQKVLIHAAAGGVGNFAVQFAKAKGAHVIGTASGKNQGFLRELGVDEAVDYQKTRFEDVVRDVDVVLDTIGGDTQERSFKVLKKGGVLVSLVQPPSQELATKYGVRALFYGAHASSSDLAEIAKLIDNGKVKSVVETVFPLAEARRAHELSQSGHARGKIVLKVA